MKTLQITPLAKARVWLNETATAGFVPEGLVEASARARVVGHLEEVIVSVEAMVPHGAQIAYGLIGVRYEPNDTGRLQCRVPYTGMIGPSWTDALVAQLDDVRLGLPKEYAPSVASGLASAADDRTPSGVLAVICAAHGMVGSSSEFFERIASAAVELALLSGVDEEDGRVISVIRGIIIG